MKSPSPHVLGSAVVVFRRGNDSFRFSRRTAATIAVLLVSLVCALLAALLIGDFTVTPRALMQTLAGNPPDRQTEFFVLGRRLPRALLAMAIGAALAVSGAIFQAITRNPLASPDVIGVSSGASAGAVTVMLVLGGSLEQVALGAVCGAIGAAGAIIMLSHRTGLHGVQLVLTGVALSAIAMALVDYVLSQVFVASATTAQTWLVGSLQGRSWSSLWPLVLTLMAVLPVLMWKTSDLHVLALGEGLATNLGVKTVRTRWLLIAAATVLVAMAVAAAGPISFIALVAPHIARGLAKEDSLLVAALVGALLLMVSDIIALYAFSAPIPVGAVTITVGGAFFLWLLWRESRSRG